MERKAKHTDVGVIVGRFQVEKLHPGHLELLLYVCGEHKRVIVLLGVSRVMDRENPLDYECRARMIQDTASSLGLNVITAPLADTRDDKQWSEQLDGLLTTLLPAGQTATLYGARKSFLDAYVGRYPTQELVGGHEHWSGTAVRDELRKIARPTEDFRAGVIWSAANSYPAVLATVDIAIFLDDCMLFVRKPDEQLWRFPGGFADPRSATYEDDAIREAWEETRLKVTNVKYVGSTLIDDWRFRGVDRIKTLLFRARTASGDYKAADDVADCKWVSTDRSMRMQLVPEHRVLFDMLE